MWDIEVPFESVAVSKPFGFWTLCWDTAAVRQSRPENTSTNACVSLKYSDPCGTSERRDQACPCPPRCCHRHEEIRDRTCENQRSRVSTRTRAGAAILL